MTIVEAVVAEYEAALQNHDYPVMHGILRSLLNMILTGEHSTAESARETARAVLIRDQVSS